MYKLVCLDIDGTLLNKERKLSPLTVSVLKKIQERTPIILASSRMPSAMKYFQDEIGISDNPMVCYNGSLIIGYDNEILLSEVIPLNILEFIAKHNSVLNYNVSTYVEDEWFTSKIDYWSNREINNTRVDPKYCIPNKELIQKLNLNKKHPHKI
ncbi:MAG: HAD family hydrolase, partial [Bacteroidia bacterium]